MPQITIDNKEAIEASIYIYTQGYNPFLSTWGAVIDRQGKLIELHGRSEGSDAQRLLLEATITALEALPIDLPVKVSSASEYLIRWVLGRLEELRENDYAKARKKRLANLDLVERIELLTRRRPYVDAVRAAAGEWPELLMKAADLACSQVDPSVPRGWQPPVRKPVAAKPKVRPVASRPVPSNVTYDDVPWE